MKEIYVQSTIDGSSEPCLFFYPENINDVPLVVGLHSWSAKRNNQVSSMLSYCRERGWALLLPEFRGANLSTNPRAREACGSQLARQDIIDAVNQVLRQFSINSDRIFVIGGSGGGHMALMMAGYAPEKWFAVSSWCPITDLALWHSYQKNKSTSYAKGMEACCGGFPGQNKKIDIEYQERSPLNYVDKISSCSRVFVHHGRFDISVPYKHTVNLAKAIESSNPDNFFYEIFDGGHELHYDRAFAWLDKLLHQESSAELTG